MSVCMCFFGGETNPRCAVKQKKAHHFCLVVCVQGREGGSVCEWVSEGVCFFLPLSRWLPLTLPRGLHEIGSLSTVFFFFFFYPWFHMVQSGLHVAQHASASVSSIRRHLICCERVLIRWSLLTAASWQWRPQRAPSNGSCATTSPTGPGGWWVGQKHLISLSF